MIRVLLLSAVLMLSSGGRVVAQEAQRTQQPARENVTMPERPLRELPASLTEQARRALEHDAWRRELRFIEAVDPGRLFRSTRIEQSAIDSGAYDADALYAIGGRLFDLTLTSRQGMGGKDQSLPIRVHRGRRGGPDAYSCAACHARGGSAGAGDAASNAFLTGDGATQASALVRNPISLSGAGVIEILAREMSEELAAIRERLLADAAELERTLRVPLSAKGVSFGYLTADADGSLGTGEVEGVDSDLTIRPFGWKGTYATLREAVEDELLTHLGMQSSRLATSGTPERVGSFGRPDPDGDGVVDEILEGQLTALTLYVAMQEVPQIVPPNEPLVPVTMWAEGRRRFESLECQTCHRVSLPLDSTVYSMPSRDGGPALEVDLARDGAEPRLARDPGDGGYRVYLLGDLKRHDLGATLAESRPDRGVAASVFLTRPLWGLSRSRPWLHDGRAPTIEDAILQHGGEARESRDRFAALSERERAPLRVFLMSLTRGQRMTAP